jgi:hypothetical protein
MTDVEKAYQPTSVAEPKQSKLAQKTEDEVSINAGDNAILPEGQIDPVYEKKAKILNRAVCHSPTFNQSTTTSY